MPRVVITGIGIISPLGSSTVAHWAGTLEGRVGLRSIGRFDASGFDCAIAGEVADYRIGDFVPKTYRKATKVMARDIELAVIAADQAIKDAGIQTRAHVEKPTFDPIRFGCNIGAGLISAELDELSSAMATALAADGQSLDLKKWGVEGMQQLTPLWLLKYLPNMLACHVTIIHGLMGPSNTITCDSASGHLAIGEAFRTIQRGKADLAICGGAESRVNPMGMMRQQLLGRLNRTHNDRPADAVRPFDRDAAGTVCGEGGGLLVLEDYEHAKARGARIYAEVVGFGASQDTTSPTEPDATGGPVARATRAALRDAKLDPSQIDLIVPHGLGLPKADQAELKGLQATFGESLSKPFFAPLKAQTGNLAAGTGADVATTALALAHGKVPPAVNTRSMIEGAKLNVSTSTREAPVTTAITLASSLGGQNAAIVLKKV
jgi:3-oxoacyl-[acyl-carrier-protein] synthase II